MQKPKLFSIIKHRKKELGKQQLIQDVIAGVIVAVIALPLSVALGIASGVSPEKGLITAIIAGFFISFLGGSRVQIGGPTGAFVVIVYGIIQKYGFMGLTAATLMAGFMLVIFGFLKFGTIIKFIPYPITTGFTAGIAVVLFSTQIKDFFGISVGEAPSEFFEKWNYYIANLNSANIASILLGIVSVLIIIYWPRVSKTVPGALLALLVATLWVKWFHLPVETIGSRFGELSTSIPMPTLVPISLDTIKELIRPALTIALLAGIESLLSATVADGMIGKKHNSNMELIAQGVANIGSAFFGGIPATGAIARTAANVKNGGRTPIAGVVHAIVLLFIMLIFMPFAKLIPMTTLAAILMVVSYNMGEWRTFQSLLYSTKSDAAVMIITFLLTVALDLVIAIEIGMVLAMFLFIKKMSDFTEIKSIQPYLKDVSEEDESIELDIDKGNLVFSATLNSKVLIYEINGPLFFGVANTFMDMMDSVEKDAEVLILRMRNASVMDATAFHALKQIEARCKKQGILLLYTELQNQPTKLLKKTGFIHTIGKERIFSKLDDALRSLQKEDNVAVTV